MLSRIGLVMLLGASWAAVWAAAQTATPIASPVSPAPAVSPVPPVVPVAAASTQPSRPAPPTLYSIVALMREEQWDRASAQMEKLYPAVPADQRTRPLVLDRALLDMRHGNTLPRAVKELSDYLIKHPAEDEPASNILGSVLDAAVQRNPKIVENASWQAGVKEWQRRDEAMDRSRSGWRRWGAKWLTDEDFGRVEEEYKRYRARVDEQQQRAKEAQQRFESRYGQQGSIYRQGSALAVPPLRISPFTHSCGLSRVALLNHTPEYVSAEPGSVDPAAGISLAQTADAAKSTAQVEQSALAEMICHSPRPEFPQKYDPIDAAELTPPPGPAPRVPTTAPATPPAAVAATQPVQEPQQRSQPQQQQQQQRQQQQAQQRLLAPDAPWPAR